MFIHRFTAEIKLLLLSTRDKSVISSQHTFKQVAMF